MKNWKACVREQERCYSDIWFVKVICRKCVKKCCVGNLKLLCNHKEELREKFEAIV